MKRMGVLVVAAVVALTAYNTWQIRRLAGVVDRRRAEASASARLEQALAHTRRARSLLNHNDTRQASAELDHAIRDVTVAADRSRQSGRSLVLSVRQGLAHAGQRVREVLKGKKKAQRA
jgi:ABC-type anion transport system duplicated permease subunit